LLCGLLFLGKIPDTDTLTSVFEFEKVNRITKNNDSKPLVLLL